MPTNTAYKVHYKLINSDVMGPRRRQDPNVGPPAYGNYFLRDWGTRDKLRAALGTYWYDFGDGSDQWDIYDAGDTRGLSADLQDPNLYGAPGVGGVEPGGGAGTAQSTALTVRIVPRVRNLGPYSAEFVINPNRTTWNDHNIANTTDSIIQNEEIMGDIPNQMNNSGNPNWLKFVMGSAGSFDWATHLHMQGGGMQGGTLAGPSTVTPAGFPGAVPAAESTPFADYTTTYFGLSDNLDDRLESGTNLQIEMVYNFYADTTPPYEKISKEASEPMLVNYYCFQSLLRTSDDNKDFVPNPDPNDPDPVTDSQVEADEYFQQVTLVGMQDPALADDTLFTDLDPSTGTPPRFSINQTQRFYELYSTAIAGLKELNWLDDIKENYNDNYKNMVMLSSDVKSMTQLVVGDEKASGLAQLPFYNKITIPHDLNSVATVPGVMDSSYLARIRSALNAAEPLRGDKFINILQLYVSSKILGSTEPTYENVAIVKYQNATSAETALAPVGTNMPVQKLMSFSDFITECRSWKAATLGAATPPSGFLTNILKRLDPAWMPPPPDNYWGTGTVQDNIPDNYILLRDYNSGILSDYVAAIIMFLDLVDNDNLPEPVGGMPSGFPSRTARQLIVQPIHAPNETLMYEVKKRLLNPDGSPGTTVQTIMIGKDFGGSQLAQAPGDITYIDTQVKYGVRYYYEINAIKIIYGNEYCYRDLYVKTFGNDAGSGLHPVHGAGQSVVANALGFTDNQIFRNTDAGANFHAANVDTEVEVLTGYSYSFLVNADAGAEGDPSSGPIGGGGRLTWGTGPQGKVWGYYVFTDPTVDPDSANIVVGGDGEIGETGGGDQGGPGGSSGNTQIPGTKKWVLTDLANNGTDEYTAASTDVNLRNKLSQLKLEVVTPVYVPDNDGVAMNDIGGVLSREVVPMPQSSTDTDNTPQWTPLQLMLMGLQGGGQ